MHLRHETKQNLINLQDIRDFGLRRSHCTQTRDSGLIHVPLATSYRNEFFPIRKF